MKRIVLSVAAGTVFGAICFFARQSSDPSLALSALIVSSFGNRILMGFVIGISR